MAPHLSVLSLWISCVPCLCDSEEQSCGVSCFMDEDIMEARELDSSITQHHYSCSTNDRLTGRMEIFKGEETHTHTHTHTFLQSSVQPDYLSVVVCVHMCVCERVSSVGPCSGRRWPARERRGGEGEWKSQLKERSLVCLLECLWEPLTVNLSSWRVRKRERNEGEDGEEKAAREIRRFDFNGPSVLEGSWLICLSFSGCCRVSFLSGRRSAMNLCRNNRGRMWDIVRVSSKVELFACYSSWFDGTLYTALTPTQHELPTWVFGESVCACVCVCVCVCDALYICNCEPKSVCAMHHSSWRQHKLGLN